MFNPHYEGVLCALLSLLYAVFIWRLCMFTTWWSAALYHMICVSSTGTGQLESCGLGGLMRRLLLLLAGRSACIIIINETCVYAVDCMAPCQPDHRPVCSGTSCAAAVASIMVIRPVPLMICCCLLYRTCCCHSTRSLQPHCLQLLIPWLSCPCCCRTMTHPHYPPQSRDVWRNNSCQMCTDVAGLLPRILINTCASIAFTFSVCLPTLCVIRLIHSLCIWLWLWASATSQQCGLAFKPGLTLLPACSIQHYLRFKILTYDTVLCFTVKKRYWKLWINCSVMYHGFVLVSTNPKHFFHLPVVQHQQEAKLSLG